MPIDQTDAAQLIADFSDAIRSGEDRFASGQLGQLTDALVEAIADDDVSVQRLLRAGLNEGLILFVKQTGATPRPGLAPGDARIQGIIEALSDVADTAIRKHQMRHLSSEGPDALALTVLEEVGRSHGLVSDRDIAHALGVRTADLGSTLNHLRESGLVQVTSSPNCFQYKATRQGLSAIRSGSVTNEGVTADSLTEDDKPSPGMRR
ncbi:hypothetical protein [Muricoccus vinaceus]|uniref:MarR family transcriptional regulator n=1 Tax=Muricoccus vinaceus TaxID=424704 RepID=A0ABV6IU71_9PROT